MDSPHGSTLITLALAIAALCCIFRLHVVHLVSTYPALVAFLLLQVTMVSASWFSGVRSGLYEYIFLVLLMSEWIVYGVMLKEIYSAIFFELPGIAVLGQVSIYLAMGATGGMCIVSFAAARHLFTARQSLLNAVTITAHSLTFGFAALVIFLLVIVSRYPIPLHRNVLVNCILFSTILLGETGGLIFDAFTNREYTTAVNRSVSILEIVCLAVWPIALSREGQTRILRLRRNYPLGDEARLLGQLNIVNSILMRASRHKSAIS